MKKIFLSVGLIAIVGIVAIGATRAYFSDSASITGNTFTAGSLNLQIDSDPSPSVQTWVDTFNSGASFANLYPGYPMKGEHNWQVIDIKKTGDVDGNATIQFDTTTWSALGDNLIFKVYFDVDNNGSWVLVDTGTLAAWNHVPHVLGPMAGADKISSVKIEWSVPASAGNDIQGQSVTLDTTFGITQQ